MKGHVTNATVGHSQIPASHKPGAPTPADADIKCHHARNPHSRNTAFLPHNFHQRQARSVQRNSFKIGSIRDSRMLVVCRAGETKPNAQSLKA